MRHWLQRSSRGAQTAYRPRRLVCLVASALAICTAHGAAAAESQRIENRTAVFAALDKVTARISKLEAKLGETVRFGALKITPRACYSRPPTETPKTSAFVAIDEILLDGKEKRSFTGWMFAESPGLHALEHPVFDVWLTSCTDPVNAPLAQSSPSDQSANSGANLEEDDPPPHRRFRPRR